MSTDAASLGNFQDVRTLAVFQKPKSERLADEDLAWADFEDISLLWRAGASCIEEFIYFPEQEFDYDVISRHVRRVVDRFRQTGSVCKGKSTGRPTVLDENTVENVQTYMERSPTKSLH
ncbi:hypothetical protein ILUMI_17669 [Ignelater luminosus]|uniref:Uncharacterized protein n=1 Tax=Ignelater luminosus TaxID=2038154 RepID=A0A8K0CJG1_IGNLU|nr:hypothetical protein ILUMI_17669 [Ignelater luminosus]